MVPPRSSTTSRRETSPRRPPLTRLTAALLVPFAVATVPAQEPTPRRTLAGHRYEVYSVAFSPDGKTLASGGGYFSADLKPGEVFLWDVETGKLLSSLKGHTGGVWSVAFSPDGKVLASGSADKAVKLWGVATRNEKATLEGHGDWVRSVAFSPDGKTLASGGNDHTVRLWDVPTGKERATLRGHKGGVTCVAFSPDGQALASNSFDGTVRVWDAAAGTEKLSVATRRLGYAMAFSPDGRSPVPGGGPWDPVAWPEWAALKPGAKAVYGVAFPPDGKALAAACADRNVRLWDVAGGREVAVFPHGNVVLSVAYSPDGKLVASGNGATGPFEVKL